MIEAFNPLPIVFIIIVVVLVYEIGKKNKK